MNIKNNENNNLNNRVIAAIQSSLPKEENIAHTLMDILLLGKESTYRRLRGEVPFTFEELAKLSTSLGFSLDNLVGINNSERTVFDINLMNPQSRIEDYSIKLDCYIHLFQKMRKTPNSRSRYALNTLPYSFYLSYYNISKFKYYRWMYQTGDYRHSAGYNDLSIPPQIVQMQKTFAAESKYANQSLIILDRNVFSSMVYDVEYFYKLNLIGLDDIELLRKELLELLDDLESVTISGRYNSGSEVYIYLSNVDLESSYCHFEYDQYQYSHLRVYGVNSIDSQSPKVCMIQKEWIDGLKRFSTLITQSGEIQRHEYFKLQRELIAAMGK